MILRFSENAVRRKKRKKINLAIFFSPTSAEHHKGVGVFFFFMEWEEGADDDIQTGYKIYKEKFLDNGLVEFPSVEFWIPPEDREEYFNISTVDDLIEYIDNYFIPRDQFPIKRYQWYIDNFNNISRNKYTIANATVLTIENIVMCVALKHHDGRAFHINTQRVANQFAHMGVTLNQLKFPSVVFKYTPPTSAVQPVFASGRIVSTGSQMMLSAMLALEMTVHCLKSIYNVSADDGSGRMLDAFEVADLEVKNLVGTGVLPFRIDDEKISKLGSAEKGKLYAATIYKPKVEYDDDMRDQHPTNQKSHGFDRTTKTQKPKKVCTLTFLLFPEGQYIVVGAAKQSVIVEQVTKLYNKLTR